MANEKKTATVIASIHRRESYDDQMRSVEASSGAEYVHPAEVLEPIMQAAELGLLMDMSARLSKLLQWLADGSAGGTMDMRAWCMLYVLRPDLIRGESALQYAKRRGVSHPRVMLLLRQFRELFPGVKFAAPSRGRSTVRPPVGSLLKLDTK